MVLTVFRARLKDEGRDAYYALAPKMGELARAMPGYKSHKVFVAEDGERVTIVEFEDEASQQGWAQQIDHLAAKKEGRKSFYAEYHLQICQVVRESSFKAD
ncbi:MAG: antibiotic biosynthesis monooxygenase [Zoogloea sp.]|jgi:heme-degrading monooxygenase HmoA|nr:antibiotic biosynthesis monooxygenase [Zoogloea sp.]